MAIKIFTLDKDNNVTINKIEITTYPAFNKILRRDTGSKGDADGRKKIQAFKEFAYIYQFADVLSEPNRQGYDDVERIKYAKKHAGLDEDWKIDSTIAEAIDIYKSEQTDISTDIILELLKTFRLSKKVITRVRQSLEKKLLVDSFNNDVAVEVLGLIETSINFGRDIPTLTKELNKAITEVQFNIENAELMRGSKLPIPRSAMPENAR